MSGTMMTADYDELRASRERELSAQMERRRVRILKLDALHVCDILLFGMSSERRQINGKVLVPRFANMPDDIEIVSIVRQDNWTPYSLDFLVWSSTFDIVPLNAAPPTDTIDIVAWTEAVATEAISNQ